MQTFGDEVRKARKARRCGYCGGWILAGAEYRRWASEDGGRVHAVHAHAECVSLWETLQPCSDETPSDPYEFRQDCYAYGGPGPFPWEP
jgi:hypothetical protein